MLDNKIINLIETTSQILGLDLAVVEKDFYVTQLLHALSSIEDENFSLVFAGGTCLAKAHRLVKRMFEDIDFKFYKKESFHPSSKAQSLKALKKFRDGIISTLEAKSFNFGEVAVRNEGRYLRLAVYYPTAYPVHSSLRPHLLLEMTASEIRLPRSDLPIITLIQDTLGAVINFEQCSLNCISIEETAAEKWVGLTRRVAGIDRGYYPDDDTLVRHIYDLSAISAADKIKNNFFEIAKDIVAVDASQFKSQHPEYFSEPIQEIKKSISILESSKSWEKRYDKFIETMVYGQEPTESYQDARKILVKIIEKM